jgi:hypothetical protein
MVNPNYSVKIPDISKKDVIIKDVKKLRYL